MIFSATVSKSVQGYLFLNVFLIIQKSAFAAVICSHQWMPCKLAVLYQPLVCHLKSVTTCIVLTNDLISLIDTFTLWSLNMLTKETKLTQCHGRNCKHIIIAVVIRIPNSKARTQFHKCLVASYGCKGLG